jgi:mannose-6-phosphate isomerase
MLYPLKFKTIYKEKIWGGDKIKSILQKDYFPLNNCGETWELSGVEGDISIVENGFLEGNNLQELIEIYMGDLIGNNVYDKFGVEFPLLIKFIDANDVLSIQVHPDDKLSKKRHKAYGKTEMWYVVQADNDAELISGFNQEVDKGKYLRSLNDKTLKEILNSEKVKEGDVFFIPAGRVHAIGSGILLAEIQQTSDVTYRIYDWDRRDDNGNERELHTDLALEAIDYTFQNNYKTEYTPEENKTVNIVECDYFKTNILNFNKSIEKDYTLLDSFVILMCLDGNFDIEYEEDKITVKKGETILIPAELNNIKLLPQGDVKLLEVYIK